MPNREPAVPQEIKILGVGFGIGPSPPGCRSMRLVPPTAAVGKVETGFGLKAAAHHAGQGGHLFQRVVSLFTSYRISIMTGEGGGVIDANNGPAFEIVDRPAGDGPRPAATNRLRKKAGSTLLGAYIEQQ
jgi:hypothetical protein